MDNNTVNNIYKEIKDTNHKLSEAIEETQKELTKHVIDCVSRGKETEHKIDKIWWGIKLGGLGLALILLAIGLDLPFVRHFLNY